MLFQGYSIIKIRIKEINILNIFVLIVCLLYVIHLYSCFFPLVIVNY